jgi:hypothetical protein
MHEIVAQWPRSLKLQTKRLGTLCKSMAVHCERLRRHEIMVAAHAVTGCVIALIYFVDL